MQGHISNGSLDVTSTVGCDPPAITAVLASIGVQ